MPKPMASVRICKASGRWSGDQLFSRARKTLPLIQGCRADVYLEQGSSRSQQLRDNLGREGIHVVATDQSFGLGSNASDILG